MNVKTNNGKAFLDLVRKHFSRHHKYSRIFNTNTLKVSYSCMPNMGNIIKQHNTKILQPRPSNQQEPCNCQNPDSCPLEGNCNTVDSVYQATVESDSTGDPLNPMPSRTPSENVYIGIVAGVFKPRYRNHKKSFNNREYETNTKLSDFIWKLKDKNIRYSITWKVLTNAAPYRCGTKVCNLCLAEKVAIARCNHKGLLNKRTELLGKCRHRIKFKLSSVT